MTLADVLAVASAPTAVAERATALVAKGRAQSLQARITAAILLTTITVLFIGCSLFMLEQQHAEGLALQTGSERLAQMLAYNEAGPLGDGDYGEVVHDLKVLNTFPHVLMGQARTADGRAVTFRRAGGHNVQGVRRFIAPMPLRSGQGEVVLDVAPMPGGSVLSHYLAMGGALFFCATALALFLGRWLAARITTPMARLSAAMESVGQSGGFQVRVEPGAPDEIGRLTQCFNVLMSRLQVKDTALRRTLAELVEARDAAEAANLAKSQFLANMSHEIRTPLNGVLAMAQILQRSPLQPGQREQVEVIHQSGETLLSLLNDILDVSKIEAGKLELEVAPFDAAALAHAVAAGFSAVAARKQLRLEVEVGPGADGVREGDAARLRQILNNFLSNALKFTETGEVRLSLAVQEIDGLEGLQVTVRDTGMGIPSDKLPLLFQKFSQLDASMTRRFGGTGLGLAICRELAELMGGRVWVESEGGRGSAFSALLPLPRVADGASVAFAEPARGEAAAANAAEPDLASALDMAEAAEADARPALRVLAAEDNPTNQLVLTTVMQIFGVELTLAGDGLEAVDAWRSGQFDVILMDIQMPRLDGVAATRRIRAEEIASTRPRTPILALSANALTHQVEAYLAAGMDGHVAKPIELAKLQAALEQVFDPEQDQAAA